MALVRARVNEDIRYEPDERCPPLVSIAVGVQGVLLTLAPVVVIGAIAFRAADQSERYLSWAVFATLVVCGITTALQAVRVGRLGAGHVLISGPSAIFLAICIRALVEGGPALMASLVVVSSLFQFALVRWLPLLRRIITPVVSGTVMMLAAGTVVPIALEMLDEVPEGTPTVAAPYNGRRSVYRRGDVGGRCGVGVACLRGLAAMVPADRDRGGVRGCRSLWSIRCSATD